MRSASRQATCRLINTIIDDHPFIYWEHSRPLSHHLRNRHVEIMVINSIASPAGRIRGIASTAIISPTRNLRDNRKYRFRRISFNSNISTAIAILTPEAVYPLRPLRNSPEPQTGGEDKIQTGKNTRKKIERPQITFLI